MSCITFVEQRFNACTRKIIARANAIVAEYQASGFKLTLRQLYYQFVSRDYIPNSQKEYKRLGSIINDARLAGELDWDAIEDRGHDAADAIGIGEWYLGSEVALVRKLEGVL